MKNVHNFTVDETASGRLDRVLALFLPDYSRTYLQNLIKNGAVSVDKTVISQPRFAVKKSMLVQITIPETPVMFLIPNTSRALCLAVSVISGTKKDDPL